MESRSSSCVSSQEPAPPRNPARSSSPRMVMSAEGGISGGSRRRCCCCWWRAVRGATHGASVMLAAGAAGCLGGGRLRLRLRDAPRRSTPPLPSCATLPLTLSELGSKHQKPPLPGSPLDRGTFTKHLFSDRLCRIEFCKKKVLNQFEQFLAVCMKIRVIYYLLFYV